MGQKYSIIDTLSELQKGKEMQHFLFQLIIEIVLF